MSLQTLLSSQENRLPGLFFPPVSEGSAADSVPLVPLGCPMTPLPACLAGWVLPNAV